MYCTSLKTILRRAQPIKGFVYESVRLSKVLRDTIEVVVFPRCRSRARCSGCARRCSTCDQLDTRTWIMTPLWTFSLVLIYTMRRVHCPQCGVVVEKVPWATGKHSLCDGFRLFLAHWARKLSWAEVAWSFQVSWADV
jgi:transposase